LEAQVPAVRRPDLLAILPARLFTAERPLTYILLAWMLAIVPSLLLSALVNHLVPGQGPQIPAMPATTTLFLLVVFAPVVETLIMGAVLLLLERLFGFLPALLLSSVGWGLAHSFQAPAWGLVIWWPFLIFSLCFLVWRRRSLALAFAIPAAVHALQNMVPALLLVSGLEG
jgi:membrane protease YdiL (CAAX protease family)